MEVRELTKKTQKTLPREQYDELLKKERKAADKLCKGMFEFLDAQGGWLEFSYRWFPGEAIKVIKLIHGEICELPMGIVKHLNNTKKKVRRYDMSNAGNIGESGRVNLPRSYETISRVRFTPVDVL